MSVAIEDPRRGRLAALRSIGGGPLYWASVGVLVAFLVVAVFAPWLAPYDPEAVDLGNTLAAPSPQHWLGTDDVGRDTLSRLIYGSRTSLVGPLFVVVFSTIAGIAVGLVAGWRGGRVDAVLTRVLDVLFAFPALLVAILVVAMFGKGLAAPIIAMSVAYMPYVARLTRSLVIAHRSRPYVASYRVQGFSGSYIALRRVLPNTSSTVVAQSTLNFGYALLDLAALSFIGLGVQPPTADWGLMVNQGRSAVLSGEPLSAVAPAVAIIVVVVAFNVVGEELGDRMARRDRS